MEKRRYSYGSHKSLLKRARQAAFRFCVYGALFLAAAVSYVPVTRLATAFPGLRWLFAANRITDPRLDLASFSTLPVQALFGKASLWLFIVFGAISLFALEPAHHRMKAKGVPLFARGIAYAAMFILLECVAGWALRLMTGYDIWAYTGPATFFRYSSFAMTPIWFAAALIAENLVNLVESLDSIKSIAYGLDGDVSGPRNKIVVISDVHIGPRGKDGSGAGWFYGLYEAWFAVILGKVAVDRRVRELVFAGDLFDTWLYPPENPPESVGTIVEAWKESLFMPALLKCLKRLDAVWYIPGNHDMHVKERDLGALSSGEKKLRLATPEEFAREHRLASGAILEVSHGHEADFFNAPDRSEDALQGLPFGYFVSRIFSATKETMDIRTALFGAYIGVARARLGPRRDESSRDRAGRLFVTLTVNILVAWANRKRGTGQPKLGNLTVIRMPEGYRDVTIGEIKRHYGSLFPEWLSTRNTWLFATAGRRGLDSYAASKCGKRIPGIWLARFFGQFKPERIVILGHTHFAKRVPVVTRKGTGLYANSGCVCENAKQAQPHWIEIEDGPKGAKVRVCKL